MMAVLSPLGGVLLLMKGEGFTTVTPSSPKYSLTSVGSACFDIQSTHLLLHQLKPAKEQNISRTKI